MAGTSQNGSSLLVPSEYLSGQTVELVLHVIDASTPAEGWESLLLEDIDFYAEILNQHDHVMSAHVG